MPIVQSLSTEKFHKEDGSAADMSDSGRKMDHPLLSGKDHEEKAQKCEFVQGLVLSTILDDDLYEWRTASASAAAAIVRANGASSTESGCIVVD